MKRFWSLTAVLAVLAMTALLAAKDDELKPDEPVRTEANVFLPPVRLAAADGVINSGAAWGHSGPWFEDVDGDGTKDLLVGDFSGYFTLYKNTGNGEAKFARGEKLLAGGVPAQVPIY